jgi:hypothetical protein
MAVNAYELAPNANFLETTNPCYHNPDNFRYLVHGLMRGANSVAHDFLRKEGVFDDNQNIDLLTEPERISEKLHISSSLIDEAHTGTWGDYGFIIEAPFENIEHMTSEDGGTGFSGLEVPLENIVVSGDELLNQTSAVQYNEIKLKGSTEFGDVRIVGCWYKKDDEPGNSFDSWGDGLGFHTDPVITLLEIKAAQLGVPVIELKQIYEPLDDEVELIYDDPYLPGAGLRMAINENGIRYFIDYEAGTFISMDEKRQPWSMTRDELIAFQTRIRSHMTVEELERFKEEIDNLMLRYDAVPNPNLGDKRLDHKTKEYLPIQF